MRKLFILLCIGFAVTVAVKFWTGRKKEAALAAARTFLEAMKQKDVDTTIEYMDYEEVVAEMDAWAVIGGEDFTVSDMRRQLKRNMEKGEFDYEILGVKAMRDGTVRVSVRLTQDRKVEDGCLIMKRKGGKWKCDLMATAKESAKMENK
jgi:hypothetical protein